MYICNSESVNVCVCNVPIPRDCFFHKVLAVTVLSLGHRK